MAEEGFIENSFIENIGELSEKNFNEKMEKFQEEFKYEDIKIDKENKTVTIDNKEYNIKEFLKRREEFITEKLQDSSGVSEEKFKEQAKEDLQFIGITDPIEAQIDSLSESYKNEYGIKLSLEPMGTKVVDTYFQDKISPVVEGQESIVYGDNPQREGNLKKAVTGISEKNPKLKLEEGFKKIIGDMSMDEFYDEFNKRQKKTTNIEEKGIIERMKNYMEEIKDKLNENKGSIGLYILLAFLGYEFLNYEIIAGSGCMVKISGANSDCRAMGFTIINKTDSKNKCAYPDSQLCKQPPLPGDDKTTCKTGYEGNPIRIGDDAICSEFCNSTYLIENDKDKTFSYNCQKCDLACAFTRVFQVIANVASDIGSGLGGSWDFLKKWGFYIIIVIAIVIVVYLITKVIQGAREIKHVLYDTETGSTTTISSHDELATLLANKEITLKPATTKFRSKK